MNKVSLIFVFVATLFTVQITKAQLVNPNDGTWQTVLFDDFNSLNTSYWMTDYGSGRKTNSGIEYNDPSNLSVSSHPGYLTIKAERLTTPVYYDSIYHYYQGGVISNTNADATKYGYYEISAIMPKGAGYWPAFWGWLGGLPNSGIPPCTLASDSWYNEIDYLENNGVTSPWDQMGGGYLFRDTINCGDDIMGGPGFQALPLPNGAHSTDEHKYACFWEPSRMTWFFDDIVVWSVYDPKYTPHNPMRTVINFALEHWVDSSTVLPAYFQINYVKISQLQANAGCSSVETFCSTAFNPSTYVYKIKKSISIGGAGCASPSTINTSSNVNLWATDYILLNEGTTINDNGSGSFSVNITECPN